MQHTSEENIKNYHHQKGLNKSPCNAQKGLLILYLNVAPGKEVEQLAKLPNLSKIERRSAVRVNYKCVVLTVHLLQK